MWLLPSRRSHLVERVFSIAPPTEPGAIIVSVEDAPVYRTLKIPANWIVHSVTETQFLRDKLNAALRDFPDESYYGIMADDMVPETPGWDVFLSEKAGSRNIALSSQPPIHNRAGTGALGGDLVRACGWLVCPAVKHFYADDVLDVIGAEFDCLTWYKDINIRHHHFSVGLSAFDTFYQTRTDQDDRAAYEEWKKDGWPILRARLAPLYRS